MYEAMSNWEVYQRYPKKGNAAAAMGGDLRVSAAPMLFQADSDFSGMTKR
jgi:hypothetical protein